MKKILSIISAAVLTAALIPIVFAEDESVYAEDGIKYYYQIENDNAVINMVDYGREKQEMTFPSEIDGHKVTEIRGAETNDSAIVKKITIPEGVVKIGSFEFSPSIYEVVLPEGLEHIETGFLECKNLRKINIPSTVKYLGDDCFRNTKISEITLPDGLEHIGLSCFANSKLKEITIPDSVKYIGTAAFDIQSLTKVNWNMSADTLGVGLFNPKSKFIRNYPEDFLLYNNGEILEFYLGNADTVVIPETVERINRDAFTGTPVKKIIYPGTMKKINSGGCGENVREIVIEEGVETIGEFAFKNAKKTYSLDSLSLPSTLKYIQKGAFQGLNLKTLKLPENLEFIGEEAFENADLSDGITIPASVTDIKDKAFAHTKMKTLTIKGTPKMGIMVFPETLEKVKAKESVITKNWRAFYDSEFTRNFSTSEGNAFAIDSEGRLSKYLGKDKDVVIPETVKKIGIGAFSETDIESVVIPASVTEIRGGAFENCKNLKKVTIKPSNHTLTIMETAFLGCDKIKNIDLPDNVKISTGVLSLKKDGVEVTPPPGKLRFSWDEEPAETETPEATDKPKVTATPKATAAPTASPEPRKLEVKGGEEITISVDGKTVEFDAQPFIDGNNRTLVPVRAVSEMLDAKVDWDEQTQTVTIAQDGKIIKIIIGSDTMTVDGNNIKMDTQAVISEERTYIPIRFAAEVLGLTVDWVE